MKKFVFIYNVSGADEHTKALMDLWMSWFKSIGDKMLDSGGPLVSGKNVASKVVKDVTSDMSPASGYSIINAASMDEAVKIAMGCPGKAGLRVYEAISM
jgi:hypothetical protein